jgi:hypothetical protein
MMNPDEFYPLNNEQMVRMYKREKIDDLMKELVECQETYIEEAVEKSGYKDAREVLEYIRKKY